MIYHVTCNTDDNYLQHCCAMLCSLFENNKEMTFHVHLLTHGLAAESKIFVNSLCQRYGHKINMYDVDETKLEGVKFRKNRPLTKAAYYRILLPELLDENIERVLYLDCDIIILGSVKELFELNLDNYALAACEDLCPTDDCHRRQLEMDLNDKAFCSGMMMVNLKFWREHESEKMLIDFSKKERGHIYYHDQDALNYVFKRQWYSLPFKWAKAPFGIAIIDNRNRPSDINEYVFTPKIIHYATEMKPWYDVWTPRRKYYVKYLKISLFPNAKLDHVCVSFRLKTWIANLRYILNRFVRPFIPNLLEMIVIDIFNVFLILYTLLFKHKNIKHLLLSLWLKKYKN
ncbi:MAG: glycosyltransferase family 8 protein [Prevotella sp.]|nr:glycosyltransferase family 8 protein [Prevotella sp.]